MPHLDLSVDQLRSYLPPSSAAEDFDDFWSESLRSYGSDARPPQFRRVDSPLATIDSFDTTFHGYDGQPVKAWLHLPRHRRPSELLPCVVQYMGYGTGRGTPTTLQNLLYSAAGYANVIMDNRGQAGSDTADASATVSPHSPGFLTDGADSPDRHYYRRLIVDAVRAVDAAALAPSVDPTRIVVAGGSQGGGLALAAAALNRRPIGVLADLPFLAHFRRAAEVAGSGPYLEIADYCAGRPDRIDRLFTTLSYFDTMNFAARIEVPALFSVGLMDNVAPPSTVFAAYNHYGLRRDPHAAAPCKEIDIYPFNGHEGGGQIASERRLQFLGGVFGAVRATVVSADAAPTATGADHGPVENHGRVENLFR